MAAPVFTRNEGESQADFRLRYKRAYAKWYYHTQVKRPPKPRAKRDPKPGRAGPKYNIIRRDGESQEDFNRRYACERQRIKRALAKGADPDG